MKPPADGDAATARRVRILIVDDDEANAESLGEVLRLEGYEVAMAHDGLHALERAETFRPDGAVLDIDLPGKDGFAIARHLRSQPWAHKLPMIALTGWSGPHDRAAAFACGFSHFLSKPANIESLLAMLPSARAEPDS